jgi:hypothetical protein
MKKNSITTIATITEAAKRSLLRLCSKELQRREDNSYIDVDVEYTQQEKKRSSINWGDLAAGFIASAITITILSYSFIILNMIYILVKYS